MLKKIALITIAIFLLISFLNLLLGIFFWARNLNRKPFTRYEDTPYLYYTTAAGTATTNGFNISNDISRSKPEDETRILVLGGSVADDMCTIKNARGESYLNGRIMELASDNKIKVLNGALPAYVTQQELLAFQMFLQHYNPDVVIALHGYNDLESFRVNQTKTNYHPAPLFYAGSWNSPIFNVVDNHRRKYNAGEITAGYYGHIQKAINFVRSSFQRPSGDSATSAETEQAIRNHISIVKDLEVLCESKGMQYINLLQPVRYYSPTAGFKRIGENAEEYNQLAGMYSRIESLLPKKPNYISLTGVEEFATNFTDDCHFNEEGYILLSETVAKILAPHLRKD